MYTGTSKLPGIFFAEITQQFHLASGQSGRCFLKTWGVGTFFRNVREKPNLPTRKGKPHPDVQLKHTTRQTLFSGRGNVPLSGHTANKFRRPAVLQLNIEGFTSSKMNVLHHLAVQYEALVILFHETHCTWADKLTVPCFALAGSSSSRKHDLATFVHDRLK